MQALTANGAIYLVSTLVCASTAALWAMIDSRRLGHPLVHASQLLAFLFWQIAMPAYLIRTRGWVGAGWALLHLIGLVSCFYLGFFAAALWAYGPGIFSAA